jgi:hypothetical protein
MTLGIAPLRTPVTSAYLSELVTGHRQARVARGAELCAGVQPGMHYASFFCLGRKPLSSASCLQFLWDANCFSDSDSCHPSLLYMVLPISSRVLRDAFPPGESVPKAVESG